MDWARTESLAYWITFTVMFLAVAQWESMRPERDWSIPAAKRWTRHAALLLIGTVFRMAVLRTTPVAVALLVQDRDWGLLRQFVFADGVGYVTALIATVLLLDLSKYTTHRLLHRFEWLWRIHRVHHSDPDFDVSTGARFHPLEGLLVQSVDLALIWLLAPPVLGVVISTVAMAAINFAEHANARLPKPLERRVRRWVITPDLHRIHHSAEPADFQRNFGELFPWWDQLLGTHAGSSKAGENFAVGLDGYRTEASMQVGELLVQPLRPEAKGAGIAAGVAGSGNPSH